MEGIEKPHTDKYKKIMIDWDYDISCTLTSLLVWDFKNFKYLVFVVQSVPLEYLCNIIALVSYTVLKSVLNSHHKGSANSQIKQHLATVTYLETCILI
jgi:hypothetical protein